MGNPVEYPVPRAALKLSLEKWTLTVFYMKLKK